MPCCVSIIIQIIEKRDDFQILSGISSCKSFIYYSNKTNHFVCLHFRCWSLHAITHFDVRKRHLVLNFWLRGIEDLSSSTQVSSKEWISVKYIYIDIFRIIPDKWNNDELAAYNNFKIELRNLCLLPRIRCSAQAHAFAVSW